MNENPDNPSMSDVNGGPKRGFPTCQSTGSALSELPLKMAEDSHEDTPEEGIALKRRVGLLSGVALIVGTMIGSGIFVSPKGVLLRSGSVGLSLVIWAGCGILSLLGALCYAELGTMITKSGAEYSYMMDAFGPLPAFLFSWVSVLVLKPSMLAIICLSLGKYVVEPFYIECVPEMLSVKLFAAFSIGVITYINCQSVKLATRIQNFFTTAKLLAIAIIVVGGSIKLVQGHTQHLATGFDGVSVSFSDIATAFYSGLWAYDGWNNLNYVTEELKNPYVNLPLAISIGIPVVTFCYILVNISYITVMSSAELLASEAVAVTWAGRVLGVLAFVMPISVALSSFGAGNGSCFTGGRLCYVAAREGHLVDILSYLHVRRHTPSPALIFNAILAICMIVPGDIGSLIDFFSFTAWLFYGMTFLALIVMRHTKPDLRRPYKVPIWIAYVVLVISVFLVVAPIVENPQIEYLYASSFVLSGLLVYIPFVHYKLHLNIMGNITIFFQLLLEVAPTKYVPD
ncbi:b(0,+)-type amino acid transporter 1-like [Uloborus diversus]|uniref:b(0,+)-type amino acid transporter 1-like n=1 Tax=Uloborus diversus TaxID=327109 RepID=UPI0024095E36|nr:b(0,+)-type amino acid transporter 1-like [Uloborus diversus]